MITALLNLEKSTAFSLEAVSEMRRGLGRIEARAFFGQVALWQQFGLVVEYAVDFRQRGVGAGRQMRGTTGNEDLRTGMPAARTADRLARLPLGLSGDGTGI